MCVWAKSDRRRRNVKSRVIAVNLPNTDKKRETKRTKTMDDMFLFFKLGYFRPKYDKNCSASFSQPLVWGACEPEVCVTRRGPGTTGCRPPPLRTGPARIPGTPEPQEPASEAGSDSFSAEITCSLCGVKGFGYLSAETN